VNVGRVIAEFPVLQGNTALRLGTLGLAGLGERRWLGVAAK
jgi:hypothetical protein